MEVADIFQYIFGENLAHKPDKRHGLLYGWRELNAVYIERGDKNQKGASCIQFQEDCPDGTGKRRL